MKKLILSLLVLIIPGIIFAFAKKNNFEFYKELGVLNSGFYYVDVDRDIESQSKKFLSDIRIFDKDEKEIKYKIIKEKDVYTSEEEKVDLEFSWLNKNDILINLGNNRKEEYLNKIFVKTNSRDFRKVVSVKGADIKAGPYFNLNIESKRGDLIYDVPEGTDLIIDFKYSNYKYLKLRFSGDEGDLNILGFYKRYKKNTLHEGEKIRNKIFGVESSLKDNDQKIIFDLKKDNLFFNQIKLLFEDKKFHRNFILYAADSINAELLDGRKRFDKNKSYWVKVDSGRLEKDEYSGPIKFNINNNKRFYRLDILNGDNQKLKFSFAFFEKFKKKIYFEVNKDGPYALYYSSKNITSPKYDFDYSASDVKNAKKVVPKEEKINNNYQKKQRSIFDDNT